MSTESFSENWDKLKSAIDQIHTKNVSSLSFEELYRCAYNLVTFRFGEQLYHSLKEVVKLHLVQITRTQLNGQQDLLLALKRVWTEHKLTMKMIRDILMYMDRSFIPNTKYIGTYETGLELFKEAVLYNQEVAIKERLQQLLLQEIQKYRSDENCSYPLLQLNLEMLQELGVCIKDFENIFLEKTREFYSEESQKKLNDLNAPDYMTYVEKRFELEEEQSKLFLPSESLGKLKAVVEKEILGKHLTEILQLEYGLNHMLSENETENLSRLYKLFFRLQSGHEPLKLGIKNYIKETGTQIQSIAKNPLEWVEKLYQLKKKFDDFLVDSFNQDKSFQACFNESFENLINQESKCSLFIARYMDEYLCKKAKKSEEEVMELLHIAFDLFQFVYEKDAFESYYKKFLAKRLLLGKSVSSDLEKQVIGKIKIECGHQFTLKLEGMFHDLQLSEELRASFKSQLKDLDLNVQVLTSSFWPISMQSNVTIPTVFQEVIRSFESFYGKRFTGRKLSWQTHLGTVDLKSFINGKKFEFVVTPYQAFILLLFNQQERLSFNEIQRLTEIPEQELKRQLISLSNDRIKLLKKEKEEYVLNTKFHSQLYRVKIPLPVQQKSSNNTTEELDEEEKKIQEDRKLMIDSVIVRIMKSRKSLNHNHLLIEIKKLLQNRFTPDPNMIKKRLESLIEREYLKRDEQDL